jgi:hypothetical protein
MTERSGVIRRIQYFLEIVTRRDSISVPLSAQSPTTAISQLEYYLRTHAIDGHVYLRPVDGQRGYINPDRSAAIRGKSWQEARQ